MLKIKLVPTGKKHDIQYRIGISEENSKITGRQIELIGYYLPKQKKLEIDSSRLKFWTDRGAKPTEGLSKLLATWKTSSNS